MDMSFEILKGDTPGLEWRFPVLRFRPEGLASGPKVYMQAGLHAGELPGPGVLHVLAAHLRQAKADGRLRSEITLVPRANPIGLTQDLFGTLHGRFDLATRTNFNRDFPLPDKPVPPHRALGAVSRLKTRLLELASGADIVLDLHGRFDTLTEAVTRAFQRHFRPARVDGVADRSTIETLRSLIALKAA